MEVTGKRPMNSRLSHNIKKDVHMMHKEEQVNIVSGTLKEQYDKIRIILKKHEEDEESKKKCKSKDVGLDKYFKFS